MKTASIMKQELISSFPISGQNWSGVITPFDFMRFRDSVSEKWSQNLKGDEAEIEDPSAFIADHLLPGWKLVSDENLGDSLENFINSHVPSSSIIARTEIFADGSQFFFEYLVGDAHRFFLHVIDGQWAVIFEPGFPIDLEFATTL